MVKENESWATWFARKSAETMSLAVTEITAPIVAGLLG